MTPSILPAKSESVMHCTTLNCTSLQCTTQHYTALHYKILKYTALQCNLLNCNALHCSAVHQKVFWPYLDEYSHIFILHFSYNKIKRLSALLLWTLEHPFTLQTCYAPSVQTYRGRKQLQHLIGSPPESWSRC